MPKFKNGQIVLLRSGGPAMTIASTHPPISDYYDTVWFDGGELRRDAFAETELVSAENGHAR